MLFFSISILHPLTFREEPKKRTKLIAQSLTFSVLIHSVSQCFMTSLNIALKSSMDASFGLPGAHASAAALSARN